MQRFEHQIVIITGAARGLGPTHARGFAEEGAKVVIADTLEEECRWLTRELGDRALFVPLDVTEEEQWHAAVHAAEEAFGPVSVLVNDAAITGFGPIRRSDPASWRRTIDVNLVGPYLGIRAVAPSMRKAGGGSIVNISSTAAFTAAPGASAYSASSWGLRGLTKAAALELGRDHIRVNSVHLRRIDAAMADQSPGRVAVPTAAAPATYAIARGAHRMEVTRLVLFLASSDASFSTGSEFLIDGGLLLGPALPRTAGAARVA
jgi:3alpha(or 20beta)-hydroxysteroid dehydrogenase